MTRAHLTKSFHGNIEGESTGDMLMATTEGGAAYVGFERVSGYIFTFDYDLACRRRPDPCSIL